MDGYGKERGLSSAAPSVKWMNVLALALRWSPPLNNSSYVITPQLQIKDITVNQKPRLGI